MNFTNDYEKREVIGRESLKLLQAKYPNYFKFPIHFTTNQYDVYDAYYHITDPTNHSIKKRVIIEIKWRLSLYPDYMLEKKKMDDLIKLRSSLHFNESEMTLLYIVFTPKETILYNIDQVKDQPVSILKANVATSSSRTNKKDKKVLLLDKSLGKVLDFATTEQQILRDMVIDKILEGVKKEIKGIDLFDNL